jgi:hypothetical protein
MPKDDKTMKKEFPKICYWCGIELTDETNKREHVPPFGFFPKGHREELITVPACEEHNTQFSLLDERFQVYIKAIGTNQVATDNFKDKVARGLNREQSKKFVESLSKSSFYTDIEGEKRLVFKIDTEYTEKFVEKVIRGLYFYHNGKPAEGKVISFSVQFYNPDLNYEELFDLLLNDLRADYMIEGDYKNPDVFRYRYFNLADYNAFLVVLNFYKGVEFIGWVLPDTLPPEIIEDAKQYEK